MVQDNKAVVSYIHADHLAPFRQQSLCDRAGLAIADRPLVHPGYGQHTRAGAGEKDFVGGVQVVGL